MWGFWTVHCILFLCWWFWCDPLGSMSLPRCTVCIWGSRSEKYRKNTTQEFSTLIKKLWQTYIHVIHTRLYGFVDFVTFLRTRRNSNKVVCPTFTRLRAWCCWHWCSGYYHCPTFAKRFWENRCLSIWAQIVLKFLPTQAIGMISLSEYFKVYLWPMEGAMKMPVRGAFIWYFYPPLQKCCHHCRTAEHSAIQIEEQGSFKESTKWMRFIML
jgi:hypothetical protein